MSHTDILISVVIPSAREKAVRFTVNALLEQDFNEGLMEILIVTPSKEVYKDFCSDLVKVVRVDKLYAPGKMRNIGAERSNGSYLAFIDDDCVPSADWISVLKNVLSGNSDIGITGCRVVYGGQRYWGRCADFTLFAAYQYRRKLNIDLGSAAILVKKDAFKEVGGFDDGLLASEDWDFSLRLRGRGWKCVFTPDTEVLHYHGRESFAGILKNSFVSGKRSGLIVQQKHREQLSWLARLSVAFRSPLLYWILITPYSLLISISQAVEFFKTDKSMVLHFPIMFISRVVYHCGVWVRLFSTDTTAR